MRYNLYITLFLMFFAFAAVHAQTSSLVSAVSNFGNYGEPYFTLPSGEFPAESGKYYLWEGRYWVGAVVDGERHVAHADYGHYEWHSLGGPYYDDYRVLGMDIFADTVEYNDFEPSAYHFPLYLTVRQTTQAFPIGAGPDQAFMIKQTLVNDGSYYLDSLYIAWVFDCDIAAGPNGDPSQANMDDLCSYQPERNMGYMWDGDNPMEPGDDTGDFGVSPGYLGISLLEAPLPVNSFQWWNWNEDPETDDEKFQFMAGIHPASGGLAFRADPDYVFDFRVLISTGPYSLLPDDSISTAMTFAVGDGLEGLNQAIDEMIDYYNSLGVGFGKRTVIENFQFGYAYPNPFNARTTIPFTLDQAGKVTLNIYNINGQSVGAVREPPLQSHWYPAGQHHVVWNAEGMASGVYIVRLETPYWMQSIPVILLK